MLHVLLVVCVTGAIAWPTDHIQEKALEYAERYPPDELDLEYGGLVGGDILLAPGDEWPPNKVNPFNAVWDKTLLWTDGILHYSLEEDHYDADEIERIEAGIEDLLNSTMVDGELCVDIRKREDADDPDDVINYVMVGKYSGCSSYIGMRGGEQAMSLEEDCITVERHGTIMHEFLHAYGFYHEHQREDRDDWVTINWDNIQPDYYSAFIKYEEGVTIDHLGTHYDYGSVLHYNAYHWAIDDTIPTIIPHDPDAEIGQRTHMSECDSERVKILYGCIEPDDAGCLEEDEIQWLKQWLNN